MDKSLNSPAELPSEKRTLHSEVIEAILFLLKQYKDQKKGLRILSNKMGIHEKTLNRILNGENKPGYQTIFKIYRVYFNEYNDAKVLELVPEVIRQFLLKNNAQVFSPEKNYSTIADMELQKNPIVSELYIIAATGSVSRDEIEFRFGNYGIELLNRMLEKNLLQETHKDIFVTGLNHPVFTGDTIVAVGSAMVAGHAKPSNGEELDKNFISFFAEGLSPEGYQQWLAIDQDAYKKKYELTRESKNLGSVRAFTFMISEKIELNNLQ